MVLIDHQQVGLDDSAEGILPRNYLSLGNNHWGIIANTICEYIAIVSGSRCFEGWVENHSVPFA